MSTAAYLRVMPSETSEYRTPGQFLRWLLSERDWTQDVLATVLETSSSHVARLVNDRQPIDAAKAIQLAEVFGREAEEFLDLQKSYDLALARIEVRPDPRRARRAHLFAELPIREMVRRGWIDAPDLKDADEVEAALAGFFGVSDPEQIELLPHAAKKTAVGSDVSAVQLAWLYRVRQMARQMVVPPYTTSAMKAAIKKLYALLQSREEARHAPRVLMEAGVRLVVVESLTSAKIDGVCFWLDERSPVIGLSMRHDRIDNFWFVLRHECEHVLRGHGLETVALDTELEGGKAGTGEDIPEQERVANGAAADFCVPTKTLKQFIARKAPIFTERDLLAFAKLIRVHPGLVAGQLQHATGRYDRFRRHLSAVRAVVLPNVLHDGWGHVAHTQPQA